MKIIDNTAGKMFLVALALFSLAVLLGLAASATPSGFMQAIFGVPSIVMCLGSLLCVGLGIERIYNSRDY